MYEVVFNDSVLYRISFFIDSLKYARKRLYTDSGLEDFLITGQFDGESENFKNTIKEFVNKKLETGFLGEIQEEGENYYKKKVVLRIRSYILVLTCTQLLKEKIIIVEDIQISI